jgi:hypothetical protein
VNDASEFWQAIRDYNMKELGRLKECIVMFSGGVESTALLNWTVEQGFKPIAVHSVWDNPKSTANTLHENVVKICVELDVELIIHEHPKYNHPDVTQDYFNAVRHWILALMSAMTQFPHIKEYYWGVNSGTLNYGDSKKSDFPWLQRAWEFNIVFEFYARLMRVDHHHVQTDDHGMRLYPPLGGMTKKEQWDSIPAGVKSYVNSCQDGGDTRCGTCYKCLEFSQLINS